MLDGSKKQMEKELSAPTDSFIESAIALTNKTLLQIDTLIGKLYEDPEEEKEEKKEEFLFSDEGLFQLEEEVKKRHEADEKTAEFQELIAQHELEAPVVEEEEEEKPMFEKIGDPNDEWDYLEHLNRLFETYRQNSHMLLPSYWHSVAKELLSYESDTEEHKFAIKTPTETIYRLIRTFLSEAPFARLLQDMKQKHSDSDLSFSEISIKENIKDYYTHIENHLTNETASDKVIIKAEHELETFNMGAASLEKRVLKFIRDVCNNLLTQAKTLSKRNEEESVIYAEATILMSRLNTVMIATPQIEFLLRAMKP
jgi:hypothetical protein